MEWRGKLTLVLARVLLDGRTGGRATNGQTIINANNSNPDQYIYIYIYSAARSCWIHFGVIVAAAAAAAAADNNEPSSRIIDHSSDERRRRPKFSPTELNLGARKTTAISVCLLLARASGSKAS